MSTQQISLTLTRSEGQHQINYQFDTDQSTQRLMFETLSNNALYEPETTSVISGLLQPGDTFVDIGAHVGYFTLFGAACVGPKGRVFSFEPDRANYQYLLANLALNQARNVTPFHWAAGGESKVVEFFFNPDCDGGHALWDPGRLPSNPQSREHPSKSHVFQMKLDDLFANARPGLFKVIKIDTEGNDVHVLRGAREFLRSARVPAVIAEAHRFGMAQLGTSEQEMRALMGELGYIPYLLAHGQPTRLTPEQYLQSKYIFNLVFVTPELQEAVASQWPQATVLEDVLRMRQEL